VLIDSHCHWDAPEFLGQGAIGMHAAAQLGVKAFLIPGVERFNWPVVQTLARSVSNAFYTLGIHPCYVMRAKLDDLTSLRVAIESALKDPRFVGIGEIGLDYFLPDLDPQIQWHFYVAQLKLARDFDLPVVLHVRRSQDMILKGLRQMNVRGGTAHAFNGSNQQADQFIAQGFCLGFGGAMTFTRALQIRRLAQRLPLEAVVLETDAPDIAPEWINHQRNDSSQLPAIAQVLAQLRATTDRQIAQATSANVLRQFSRMQLDLLT
jgi:TatD DNase family protein